MSRILFVDDESNEFETWGRPLDIDFGWEIRYVQGPKEALDVLNKELYNVVIIDRQMIDPDTGELSIEIGDRLLRSVVAHWPYICPIILTNFGDIEAAQRATRYGAYRYLVKGTDVEQIDAVCRRGILSQSMRRMRHTLLASDSIDAVVKKVKAGIQYVFDFTGYCFAYLELGPHGIFLVGDWECTTTDGTLPKALTDNEAFLERFDCAQEVVETRQFSLKTTRNDIKPHQGTLLNSPGSQLIVPVFRPEEPKTCQPNEVVALIWIESILENAFDQDVAEILSTFADYVGIAFDRAKDVEKRGSEERNIEREGLMAELSHRICNPLQVAQSNLDLLAARLRREDVVETMDLSEEIGKALNSIEQAIQAAYLLRNSTEPRSITLKATDLHSLLREVIKSFQARVKKHGTVLLEKNDSTLPKVMLDVAEMRYILSCLLENALEAIEAKRNQTNGKPETGQIHLSLCSDPEDKGVLLSIEDNGCGISADILPRVFERWFTTKEQDFRKGKQGLGLWEAKRFIKAVGGTIEARNRSSNAGGGALFRIVLPACNTDDMESRNITL